MSGLTTQTIDGNTCFVVMSGDQRPSFTASGNPNKRAMTH